MVSLLNLELIEGGADVGGSRCRRPLVDVALSAASSTGGPAGAVAGRPHLRNVRLALRRRRTAPGVASAT